MAAETQPVPKQSSKELLLASAATLFTERGYDAVSTREIADRAGVNLALIQYHFGSKAKLFLDTVDFLTDGSVDLLEKLRPLPQSANQLDGAVELCHFIRDFLGFLFEDDCDCPCELIFREVFRGSSGDQELYNGVVSFAVERFITPVEERVLTLLRFVLPEVAEESLKLAARSLLGQCSFYMTHRPFIEQLEGKELAPPYVTEVLARHIAQFTLAALLVSFTEIRDPQKFVDNALQQVFTNHEVHHGS